MKNEVWAALGHGKLTQFKLFLLLHEKHTFLTNLPLGKLLPKFLNWDYSWQGVIMLAFFSKQLSMIPSQVLKKNGLKRLQRNFKTNCKSNNKWTFPICPKA